MKLRVLFARSKAALAPVAARSKAVLSSVAAKSKAVFMSLALGASLTLPALASEGGGSSSDMTNLLDSTDNITTMMGKVWTLMMSNPLLTTYVASGLLSVGIGFFMYLKKAARH